jgi:high-affinity iron transporter
MHPPHPHLPRRPCAGPPALRRALAALALSLLAGRAEARSEDPHDAARRVLATSSLAAKEYAIGVAGGAVVSPEEVDEARLFLGQARLAAGELDGDVGRDVLARVDALLGLVEATADPAELAAGADALAAALVEAFGGIAEAVPPVRFERAAAHELFQANCAICHGPEGRGDGTAAASHDPPPTDLTDPALADQAPLDYFRKIGLGVSGTAMPAFEVLSESQRWALAWYATALRGSEPDRGRDLVARLIDSQTGPGLAAVPADLGDPEVLGRRTDQELAATVRELAPAGQADDRTVAAAVAWLRTLPFAEEVHPDASLTWASVRAELARALRDARQGDSKTGARRVLDAYVAFEGIETELALRDRALATNLEADFAELRGRLEGDQGARSAGTLRSWEQLDRRLSAAQARLAGAPSRAELGFQSFLLLLREGIEAILIIGLLAAVVARSRREGGGEPHARRPIRNGVVLALVASAITAVLVETVFHLGVQHQEILEGVTMLVAAAVLVFVGHWLIARVEVNAWKSFLATQARHASSGGSALALGGAAFLAVYREGFETVLFYKALLITAEGTGLGAIVLGAAIAAACLVAIYVAISRFGVRIPLRPFFAITSAGLLYLAVSFGGRGVAELQESDLIRATVLDGWPRLPWLGLYPTAESLALQGAILLLIGGGLIYTFLIKPRLPVAGPA